MHIHVFITLACIFGLRNSDLTISGLLRWTHQPLVPILQQAGSAKGWAQSSLQLLIKKKKKDRSFFIFHSWVPDGSFCLMCVPVWGGGWKLLLGLRTLGAHSAPPPLGCP